MTSQRLTYSIKDLDLQKIEIIQTFGNHDDAILAESDWEKMLHELDFPDQMQGGYYIYDDLRFDKDKKIISVGEINFNVGPVLFPRFKYAEKLAITVCTAGSNLDKVSTNYKDKGDYLHGYFIDALGAVIAEKVLENVRMELKNSVHSLGYSISGCYCPGYCDWPLSEQKKIFELLPENYCHVRLTDSCLMVPLKSVSGLIGIGVGVKEDFPQCRICTMENCYMRKEAYTT
jgi:hypothetical protein